MILVTGGTGTLGRAVVRRARAAGTAVRVLSRRPGPDDTVVGDLTTGAGLAAALHGVSTVIHCATDPRASGADVRAAEQLLAIARDGRPHLVYISIVGVDRIPLRYYREKLAVERFIEESGAPWTILRTTQFHELVRELLRRLARFPVVPAPSGTSVQPIDVDAAAVRLLELAAGRPARRVPDLGGPQVRTAADLARSYLRHIGSRRPVFPVPFPGRIAAAYRQGFHLAPQHPAGGRSWEEFLAGEREGEGQDGRRTGGA